MAYWRANIQGTKAYPTILIPNNNVNWGLPKVKCLKRLYIMLIMSDKFQGKPKKDDVEYLLWQRSSRSSQRWLTTTTRRRGTVNMC